MTDPARTAVAVALLANDEIARKLVLSWHFVPADLKDRAVLAAWARLSGVAFSLVERLSHPLLAHQLCLPDRTVDPAATQVLNHVAAAELRGSGRSRR